MEHRETIQKQSLRKRKGQGRGDGDGVKESPRRSGKRKEKEYQSQKVIVRKEGQMSRGKWVRSRSKEGITLVN